MLQLLPTPTVHSFNMPVVCLLPTELDGEVLQLWLADTFGDLATIDTSVPTSDLLNYRQALVAGNATPGDGGGGLFSFVDGSSETVNGVSVSAGSTSAGRWLAVSGVRWLTPPTVAASAGRTGDWALNGFYRFQCIATNTWRRSAHSTF